MSSKQRDKDTIKFIREQHTAFSNNKYVWKSAVFLTKNESDNHLNLVQDRIIKSQGRLNSE